LTVYAAPDCTAEQPGARRERAQPNGADPRRQRGTEPTGNPYVTDLGANPDVPVEETGWHDLPFGFQFG
jgi:hypothetical protein